MTMLLGHGQPRYADRLDDLDKLWLLNKGCVLWFRGKTTIDFPILPPGVTATPIGTFSNDMILKNQRLIKTFNGSTNGISLTDDPNWDIGPTAWSIGAWVKFNTLNKYNPIIGQDNGGTSFWTIMLNDVNNISFLLYISGVITANFGVSSPPLAVFNRLDITNSGNSTPKIYWNSVQQTVNVHTAWSTSTAIATLLYVGSLNRSGYFSATNIKDLIFCKTTLEQSEISYIYNTTKKYLVH
jgi:hypothetical protein